MGDNPGDQVCRGVVPDASGFGAQMAIYRIINIMEGHGRPMPALPGILVVL
jgi:hypothetical protein